MKRWGPAATAVILAVATVLTGACTPPAPQAPEPPVVAPAPRGAALAERINAFLGASRWGRYDRVADVLVIEDGHPLVDLHRLGPPDRRREIDGVTAAVLAALVGIALANGSIADVRTPLAELLPDPPPPELAGATLHDLLVGPSTDHVGLLSAVLTRATGRPAAELAREQLFAPLRIEPVWTGTTGPAVTAREMATLGALWLDGGVVGGRQVVPQEWVQASVRPYLPTGRRRLPYAGYRQWVARAGGHAATVVTGSGGHLIEVVPALDLVVVVACDEDPNPQPAPPAGSEAFVEMVTSIVLPALG